MAGGGRSAIYALRSELDAWWTSRGVHLAKEEGDLAAPRPANRRRALWAAGLVGILAVVGLALYSLFLRPHHLLPPPKVTPLTSYGAGVYHPSFSPDGTRVAFNSSRSGSMEIWVAGAGGSSAFQLTSFGGAAAVAPRWSPDSRKIVFRAASDLYVVSVTGGQPRRLNTGGSAGFASWSHDGRWIYFESGRSGVNQCWKIPSGGGEAVQVTRGGGAGGFESPDGRFLYYFRRGQVSGAVWRVPVAGGEEQPVIETQWGPPNIAVNAEGIYTVSWPDYPLPGLLLRFYRFTTGKTEVVGTINGKLGTGLAVSPDGRWLLFTDFEMLRGDLMLVENFR